MSDNNIISSIESESEINTQIGSKTIYLDWRNIESKETLIEIFYNELWCPQSYWKNWDAFWDTITDNQFWVKSPLVIIIKNYNYLFWTDQNDRYIYSDILINLTKEKRQKYFIYILD